MEELLLYFISAIKPRDEAISFAHWGDVYVAYDRDAILCRNAAYGEVDITIRGITFRCGKESFEKIKEAYGDMFGISVIYTGRNDKEG